MRISSAVWTAFTFSTLACSASPRPCLSASTCPGGTECLAARCVLDGSVPVDPESERVVAMPTELALATVTSPEALGPSITLGNSARSPVALYLRFEQTWRPGSIVAAFLLLEPTAGAITGPDLELEVWRVAHGWAGPGFAWSEKPGFAPPSSRAIARSAPRFPVRFDVTRLVRFLTDHPAKDHGLVLRAVSETGPGITLDTGLGGGVPPRLEVYFARAASEPRPPAP